MRAVKIAKFAAGAGVIPDVIYDPNRQNRVLLISDAEYAAIALSGVLADELAENAEALILAGGLTVTGTTGITGATTVTGDLAVVGNALVTAPTKAIGYGAGAGDVVTQSGSASTGVALSKPCGQITTVALTTAGAAEERFTVTNTLVDANDVIAVSTTYNGQGTPMVGVINVATSAFDIVITNLHASALNAVLVVNFVLLKSVVA